MIASNFLIVLFFIILSYSLWDFVFCLCILGLKLCNCTDTIQKIECHIYYHMKIRMIKPLFYGHIHLYQLFYWIRSLNSTFQIIALIGNLVL